MAPNCTFLFSEALAEEISERAIKGSRSRPLAVKTLATIFLLGKIRGQANTPGLFKFSSVGCHGKSAAKLALFYDKTKYNAKKIQKTADLADSADIKSTKPNH